MSPFDACSHTQICMMTFSVSLCPTPGVKIVIQITCNVMARIPRLEEIIETFFIAFALGMLVVNSICGLTPSVRIHERYL